MGSVWPPMVIEGDPRSDGSLCLRPGLPGMQVDAFVFQGPPQALDEDVVEGALANAFAIHRDADARPSQAACPGMGQQMSQETVGADIDARFRTGTPGLDAVLLGGLTPSRLYLVEGTPDRARPRWR